MPTSFAIKPQRTGNSFALFVVLLGVALFGIELADPAPMESRASSYMSP